MSIMLKGEDMAAIQAVEACHKAVSMHLLV